MQQRNVIAANLANDPLERERWGHLRPGDWRNPRPAQRYDLVVVGAGTAGVTAAYTAAGLGAKVALVERHLIGGNCLNIGCVPSKAIIRTSRVYADMRNAARYGACAPSDLRVDFAVAMERMRGVRARLSRGISVEVLTEMGVDVFFGMASFTGNDALEVDGATLRFRKAIIASGARPDTPDIPGLAEAGYFTNENVFDLTEPPRSLLVIGGGPLGCEMAQAFCRLGVKTTIVQHWPLFLPREERDAAQILSDAFARDGIEIRLNTKPLNVRVEGGQKVVDLVSDDYRSTVSAEAVLTGTGRVPNVEGLNLVAAGVEGDDHHGVVVDDFLRTANPRIYAAGDVCLEDKFNDAAGATARIAVRNALFRGRERLSALVVPWCTYTDPEVAHVGLYVRQANARGIPVKTFTIPMHEVPRAVADNEQIGFVKIVVAGGTDRILGATIVARHAGEMISEVTLAMTAGIGLRKLARVIHAYPTQAEGIKMAADAYDRTHLGPRRRRLAAAWLRWMRR
ncbi:MAG TPA: mercuric reductase [Rhodanobacteraceae bacterium]|nr:mercuric reductase [Rhodanobacteraceae bacterium]